MLGSHHLGPRLQKLFLGRFYDNPVSVPHHRDQHVQQEDWNQHLKDVIGSVYQLKALHTHLKDYKDNFCHLWIWRRAKHPIVIVAQGHVEQADPRCVVFCVQRGVLVRLDDEEEGLAEA